MRDFKSPDNFVSTRQTFSELVGGDEATGGNGVNLVADQEYLLTRLALQSIQPGQGTFKISLVEDQNLTFFLDKDGANVNISAGSYLNSGTVNISAVPEPASYFLIGTVMTILGYRNLRRKCNCAAHSG